MSLHPRRHPEITEEMRRILQLLTQLRGGFGHGEAALLDRKLGRAEGYLGRVLRHDIGLRTDTLLQILQVFEVDPSVFFQQIFAAPSNPALDLGLLQRRLTDLPLADGSRKTSCPGRRERKLLEGLETLANRLDDGESTTPRCEDPEDISWEAYDRQVFDQPENVVRPMTRWLSKHVDAAKTHPTIVPPHGIARALETLARANLAIDQPATAGSYLQLAWRFGGTISLYNI